jgi:hypothetical protein
MPTVLREGPLHLRVFCLRSARAAAFSFERDRQAAKFWLEPVSLAFNDGFAQHELNAIERRVLFHQAMFLRAWNDFFSP